MQACAQHMAELRESWQPTHNGAKWSRGAVTEQQQ